MLMACGEPDWFMGLRHLLHDRVCGVRERAARRSVSGFQGEDQETNRSKGSWGVRKGRKKEGDGGAAGGIYRETSARQEVDDRNMTKLACIQWR
jgi:hypothetical protein